MNRLLGVELRRKPSHPERTRFPQPSQREVFIAIDRIRRMFGKNAVNFERDAYSGALRALILLKGDTPDAPEARIQNAFEREWYTFCKPLEFRRVTAIPDRRSATLRNWLSGNCAVG